MANTLYNQLNPNNNSPLGFFNALQQLKAQGGDPNQRIQQMLNSGQITQQQYNDAVAKAEQLRRFFGG